MTIDIRRLQPDLQAVLDRSGMEAVREFIAGYAPDKSFDGSLDTETPILGITEQSGDPPFIEIFWNVILQDGTRKMVRCTISPRGLFPTAGVVMLTPDGRLVIFHEFRIQSGCTYVSIPSGCRHERESLLCAALREGRSEAGYRATSATKIHELPAYGYHGAMLSMEETVFVVTNVEPAPSEEAIPTDSDEWIVNRRLVTPFEFAKLVRNPPPRTHLHGPTLACVAIAQAHGFFLPSADDLAALALVREDLRPATSE